MFVVFDLDGTLANIEHRLHHIMTPPKDWDSFFLACSSDAPITPLIETMKAHLHMKHRVEIWTGRSEKVRRQTENWLSARSGRAAIPIKMRKEGDRSHDDVLKRGWLMDAITAGTKPDLVYEDRKRVVDMWREHDVLCAQVAPGDF